MAFSVNRSVRAQALAKRDAANRKADVELAVAAVCPTAARLADEAEVTLSDGGKYKAAIAQFVELAQAGVKPAVFAKHVGLDTEQPQQVPEVMDGRAVRRRGHDARHAGTRVRRHHGGRYGVQADPLRTPSSRPRWRRAPASAIIGGLAGFHEVAAELNFYNYLYGILFIFDCCSRYV